MLDRNENYWHSKFFNANTLDLAVDSTLLIQDTYITNSVSDVSVIAYERKGQKFIELYDVTVDATVLEQEYAGGQSQNTLYQTRNTLKVGGSESSTYRSLLFLNIKSEIENAVKSITGYTVGMDYSVLNATLTLTSAEEKSGSDLQIFMLPTGVCADESATWTKPSQSYSDTWDAGGAVEPQAAEIMPTGTWNGYDVSFDITPLMNIWRSSGKDTIGVAVKTTEPPSELLQFHSQQAPSTLIGTKSQTNAVFLGAGSANSITTEGIVVKIEQQLPYLTVESAETQETGSRRWSAFNASVSVGDTFSMLLPDFKTSASTYTLVDKRSGTNGVQMVVSGDTGGFSSTVHTAAEFTCTGTVASGLGIVQFSAPDNSLVTDLSTLKPNDTVIFEYTPTISPNNAKSYTVDFYSDERSKNNRLRLYLKEETATENRTGLNTNIKRTSIRPRLSLVLSV